MNARQLEALLQARALLGDLVNARLTPRMTRDLRARCRAALMHYPSPEALVECAQQQEPDDGSPAEQARAAGRSAKQLDRGRGGDSWRIR